MKKTYIKPEIEVMLLETEAQMMTTSPGTEPGFGDGDADGDGEVLSIGRRGIWGNLWGEEK
jgi:hypothetical protein